MTDDVRTLLLMRHSKRSVDDIIGLVGLDRLKPHVRAVIDVTTIEVRGWVDGMDGPMNVAWRVDFLCRPVSRHSSERASRNADVCKAVRERNQSSLSDEAHVGICTMYET
jgi:hypothetical protein